MQPNEKLLCPHCKEQSMAKLRNKMDGFKKVGEELVCMLCNKVLAPYEPQASAPTTGNRLKALGELLGGGEQSAAIQLTAGADEKRFCKDCRHFMPHPFVDRCDLDNRPVEAMDDCGEFTPRI
ncbi:MAG: hypothetical protein E7056_04085 [Lentisphaerae bacterium]|nr:hypothetical protein [Lentisphaerota bacterium]